VAKARSPRIYVLAGPNGGGKSSIGGAMMRAAGASYYNPDEVATRLRRRGVDAKVANGLAWQEGKRLLERAIAQRLDFAFETTLGGATLSELLERAARAGFEVRIWYVALASPEAHLARIRARVKHGGHDIPEGDVRRRYDSSRINLIRLLPHLSELRVYDNSSPNDPKRGLSPEPRLIVHAKRGAIVAACELEDTPAWARPIVAAVMRKKR
jgi:predicted ABC-type ATPase